MSGLLTGLSTAFLGLPGLLANKNIRKGAGNFLFGSPETRENVSTLRPEQEGLYNQLLQAGQGQGAGGAFGQSADYYRGLLGDQSQDFNAFAAPEMRRYSQDIAPGISEQFAGFGAGGSGLNSSGFRNAQVQGGVDLAERLAQLRASLRQSGAQGLQNIGQLGLGNYSQNMVTQPGTEGLISSLAPAIGTGIGAGIGGPIGAQIGGGLGSWFGQKNGANQVGANSSPYGGNGPQASPSIPTNGPSGNRYNLPTFMQR